MATITREEIKEAIKSMTVLELAQLVKDLEEEFGVSAAAMVAAVPAAAGAAGAAAPAEEAIVVVNPEVSSVRDADRIIGLLESMDKGNLRLVINRIRLYQVKKGEMLSVEDIEEILQIPKIGIVPDEEKLVDFTNRGEPIVLHKELPAAKAIMNIARRLEGEEVPFTELEEKKGFLAKLFGR